jgi:hypothetical protein
MLSVPAAREPDVATIADVNVLEPTTRLGAAAKLPSVEEKPNDPRLFRTKVIFVMAEPKGKGTDPTVARLAKSPVAPLIAQT